MRKKVFFDMEFTSLKANADPISIGLISECGLQAYAEFSDFRWRKTNRWVRNNVLPNLYKDKTIGRITNCNPYIFRGTRRQVATFLRNWFNCVGECEMWGDVMPYDWVLFCSIFGGAEKIPSDVYYIPFDISTLMAARGIDPDINRHMFLRIEEDPTLVHNSMWDAKVNKSCYDKITSQEWGLA